MHLIPLDPTGSGLSAWETRRELRDMFPTEHASRDYLDMFTFRFNRRNSGSHGLLFYRLLEQAVVLPPVKGADLVGGRQITTNGG